MDRKQSLTCHIKGEISHGIYNHPQPVRDETTLREGFPADDYNGEQKATTKAHAVHQKMSNIVAKKLDKIKMKSRISIRQRGGPSTKV